MSNIIERLVRKRVKSYLTKVKPHLPNPNFEYRLIFKKDAIATIKKAKGWKTNSEMARNLGITKQYMSMLDKTGVSVSTTILTRLAVAMGNIEKNWWIWFEIVPWGVIDRNHPTWNAQKEMGQIPYSQYSTSAELRSKDYKTETVENG